MSDIEIEVEVELDVNEEQKLEEIHKQAIKRFGVIQDAEREERQLMIEDQLFVHAPDGQWSEDAIEKRKNRPRFTINRIASAIDQLTGDQRQNRTDIKVIPVAGGADKKKADIFNGIIRNIESRSKASNAYDNGFDEQVSGGFGGWRVVTEFNTDDSFDQDVLIKPIESAASSLWFDLSAKEYDRSDGMFAFLTTKMSKEEYEEKYEDEPAIDFNKETFGKYYKDWFDGDNVTLAEYWVKEPYIKTIALLSDGRVICKDEEVDVLDELQESGVTIVNERAIEAYRVKSYIMNGSKILKGPMDWAGKHIPLVPVYGKKVTIENRTFVRGLVRFAKDPSRVYNYATSAAIEAAALSPKDPVWLTAAQAKGHERQLANFNNNNTPFMFYNADPQAAGVPQRTGAPSVQTALLQQIQQAATDIHSTTGIEPASLGNSPELKSGKAIVAQQTMGDRGSFIYTDNLAKSIEFTGEILVDLIPKIYDSTRIVRVLGLDGSSESVEINQLAIDEFNQPIMDRQTGKQVIVNDLTVGKYDVTIETGPSYSTQRQESAQQLIDLANGNPVFGQVAIDLISKNLNILEGDELTKRVRRMMIKDGIVDPTDDEVEELGLNQPQQPDPAAQALTDNVNLQTEKLISDIQIQEVEQQRKNEETQAKIMEGMAKMQANQEKWLDEFALKLTEMEQKEGQQLNQEVQNNFPDNSIVATQ
tara:strand:- start:10716 stop:12824 length:2109 start_codon:yes stop_codon:yes gene_type:complete